MKFSTKVLLDRVLGKFLCILLIPIVRVTGLLLRRDHSISKENISLIVVAKYYGLGSITHAMPMLKALKETYPNATLLFLTTKKNNAIIPHINSIDNALYVDDKNLCNLVISTLKLFLFFFKKKPDLFFDLEVFSAYGAIVSLLCLARNRLGFFSTQSRDFKAWIYTHLMYFNFQMPVRLCYLQLARMVGVSESASTDLLPYNIEEKVRKSTRKKLLSLIPPLSKGILAVNINASELSFARRWPLDHFAKVVSHFSKKGYTILLLGSPSEREYVQRIFLYLDNINQNSIINVAGTFTFSEVLALLQESLVLLTNDTGILNFGYAQGTKLVALFGPNHPQTYHVVNANNKLIWKNCYCCPCLHQFTMPPCLDRADCMKLIQVNEVIEATAQMLEPLISKKDMNEGSMNAIAVISDDGQYVHGALRIKE